MTRRRLARPVTRLLGALLGGALLVGTLVANGGLLPSAHAGDRTPRLYAVGHSWVVGDSSGRQIGYLHELATGIGAPVVQADHAGFEAPQVLRLVDAAPRCRGGDLAVVQVGLNDVRRRGDRGLRPFRRALARILTRLDRCDVIVVREPGALSYTVPGARTVGNAHVLAAYQRVTARLVGRHRRVSVVAPQLGPQQYLTDGLHPNLSGNRAIAAALARSPAWRDFAARVATAERRAERA